MLKLSRESWIQSKENMKRRKFSSSFGFEEDVFRNIHSFFFFVCVLFCFGFIVFTEIINISWASSHIESYVQDGYWEKSWWGSLGEKDVYITPISHGSIFSRGTFKIILWRFFFIIIWILWASFWTQHKEYKNVLWSNLCFLYSVFSHDKFFSMAYSHSLKRLVSSL